MSTPTLNIDLRLSNYAPTCTESEINPRIEEVMDIKTSHFQLCTQSPQLIHTYFHVDPLKNKTSEKRKNKKDKLFIPSRKTSGKEAEALWEERASRWSVGRQRILDQEDIVYYQMISPPCMERLSSCYGGQFAVPITRSLLGAEQKLTPRQNPNQNVKYILKHSFWSFIKDLGPKPFDFPKINICHSLWNNFVDGSIWKILKLDLVPWKNQKSDRPSVPPSQLHTKHFDLHIPFGFSLEPSESKALLKTVSPEDIGLEEEGIEETLVCMREIFLYLFFNQFLLTPRFLRCAWRPLYGEIAFITEKYEGDLTTLPRTMLRHLPKQELIANLSQEILFLVRSISLLGWFCFDLKL